VTLRRESLCPSSGGVRTPAMHRIVLRDTFLSQAA
jgi:hypothetical protein